MLQKRYDQRDEQDCCDELAPAETMRSANDNSLSVKSTEQPEEGISLFWRVFGGTILSIAALISITLFNSMNSSITELRNELNREREARSELVKKDEFNSRTTAQYERMRSFEGYKVELEALKERVSSNAVNVESLKKDGGASLEALKKEFVAASEGMRKDFAALEVLKERIAAIELLKKDFTGFEVLRERFNTAAADLKTTRDELTKIQQEVERNKIADLERKTSRDSQYKQVDEALKELQKGLQTCREKLARLEGAQPVPAPGTTKPPKE